VSARAVSGRIVDGSIVVEAVHRTGRAAGALPLVDGDGPTGRRPSRDPRPGDVDADDIAGMVGGPVWDAWCRGERAS